MANVIKFNCGRASNRLITLNKTIDGIICHLMPGNVAQRDHAYRQLADESVNETV